MYTNSCHADRELLIDCYSHYVGPTQKCRDAFDSNYFNYVLNKDYWGACRSVKVVKVFSRPSLGRYNFHCGLK